MFHIHVLYSIYDMEVDIKSIDFAIDFACDMVIMIYLVCRTKFNIFTDKFHQNQHLLMLGLILFKMPQRT